MSRTQSTTGQTLQPWYRNHLFIKQGLPTLVSPERVRIRTLDYKPPEKKWFRACMCGAERPIDAIGNQVVLRKLGLHEMADWENAILRVKVEAIP